MDETKETQENSLPKGKASEGSEGTTPKPEVYTKAQLDEAIQKDRIQRGRDAKTLEQRVNDIKAREGAIAKWQADRDAAELAEAQKDPDKLAAYQQKQADRQRRTSLDEREAAIAKREAEHEAEITAAREAQKEIVIWQIASAKNIDPMRLKTLSEKLSIEGKERLEVLADEIGSGKTDKQISVDSGVTTGGKALPDTAKGKIKAGWEEIHK